MAPTASRLLIPFMFLAALASCKEEPKENNAVIPVPKLENDCYDWWQRHEAVLAAKGKIDPEIVLIGDSITHYWGGEPQSPGAPRRGPKSWEDVFGGKKVLNLGFGWDRTQNVLWRLGNGEIDGLEPKWIVLNIGTNNSTGTQNARENTPAETAAGVEAILTLLKEKTPDSKVILMGVFPRGTKANDPARAFISELNSLLAKIAQAHQLTFIDLREKFLDGDGKLRSELMADVVHPAESGYAVWAEALKAEIK
ncbi:GDSL-type esterase/lipase family protein [Haloferula sp. BvORR071]|uniref:GDSL-type esterase/lipase family protein n=1 Tax=Haloferula sp. BvORR071 TaxID=1396141 RepID=UPI0009DEA826|nr:GDSL-type esterase/lipase family protein [Haloferula sp. BvORR071]